MEQRRPAQRSSAPARAFVPQDGGGRAQTEQYYEPRECPTRKCVPCKLPVPIVHDMYIIQQQGQYAPGRYYGRGR